MTSVFFKDGATEQPNRVRYSRSGGVVISAADFKDVLDYEVPEIVAFYVPRADALYHLREQPRTVTPFAVTHELVTIPEGIVPTAPIQHNI